MMGGIGMRSLLGREWMLGRRVAFAWGGVWFRMVALYMH